jgi:chromosome segregation ATPase
MEQALAVIRNKNLEYVQQLDRMEVKLTTLRDEINRLNEDLEKLEREKGALRLRLGEDHEDREDFKQKRSDLDKELDQLEGRVEALKQTISAAERTLEHLQEEGRKSTEKYREMADKVYGLMDSLRLNQVEVKKLAAEILSREKKYSTVEKTNQNMQAKLQMEKDARDLCEEEKRTADLRAQFIRRECRKIDETIAACQKMVEKYESDTSSLQSKIASLQSKSGFLGTKVDHLEDEKSSLKIDLQRLSDDLTNIVQLNRQTEENINKSKSDLEKAVALQKNLLAELKYIKRENDLDESGRQRPVMIQGRENGLLESLQINEFLYHVQSAERNPTPHLVEKIAQLLEILHMAQASADRYLSDLSKSNALVSVLRSKNLALCERVNDLENFKSR